MDSLLDVGPPLQRPTQAAHSRAACALRKRIGGSLPRRRERFETPTSTRGLLAQVLLGLPPGRERGEQGPERLWPAEDIALAVGDPEGHQSFADRLGFHE